MKPDDYERDIGPLSLAYHASAWVDMLPHIGTLAGLARESQTVVEIGVRGAVSSWAILDGLPADGTLYSVDAIDVVAEGTVPRRVREDPRWRFLVGDYSAVKLPARADFVFVDAGHEYEETVGELALAKRLRAKIVALHDCYLPGVADAIAQFDGYNLTYEFSNWGLAVLRR